MTDKHSDIEELPFSQSIAPHWHNDCYKYDRHDRNPPINYKLINRKLLASVGKKWNNVYSDFLNLYSGEYERSEIISRLKWVVCTSTEIVNGKIKLHDNGIISPKFSWFGFYVHPTSGCLVKNKEKQKFIWLNKPKDHSDFHKLIDGVHYFKKNGLWYKCKIVKIAGYDERMLFLNEIYTRNCFIFNHKKKETMKESMDLNRLRSQTIGQGNYVKPVKQLNHNELKALGLINTNVAA